MTMSMDGGADFDSINGWWSRLTIPMDGGVDWQIIKDGVVDSKKYLQWMVE